MIGLTEEEIMFDVKQPNWYPKQNNIFFYNYSNTAETFREKVLKHYGFLASEFLTLWFKLSWTSEVRWRPYLSEVSKMTYYQLLGD